MRDVRHWLNQVLPSEQYRQTAEPGKKPSIQQAVKAGSSVSGRNRQRNASSPAASKNRIWNFNQSGACHFPRENDRRFSLFQEDLPIERI